MRQWLASTLRPALVERVPRDHQEPDDQFRRRRVVTAVTLCVGAALLALSFTRRPGDPSFYALTLGVAATWLLGGFASGPLHLGYLSRRGSLRRPVLTPIALGVLAGGIFLLGAVLVREVEPLRSYVAHVLAHARKGDGVLIAGVTVVNAITEEVFFRGALFAAIGRKHPVLISTAVYASATIATANPMLVFAAVAMGLLFGLQRRASGGILASMLTHVTWSAIMLAALPPVIGR